MIVKKIRSGWFRDQVKLYASEFQEATFGGMLGSKTFWINEGDTVTMRLPKSWMLEEGEEISLERLVMYNQDKFGWHWK
jgi:hypothetical protein